MMARTPKIGLQAIFETQAFQRGLTTYLSGLEKAGISTEKVAAVIQAAELSIAVVGTALAATVAVVLAVAAALVVAAGAVVGLTVVFTKLAIAAAPLEKMGIAAKNLERISDGFQDIKDAIGLAFIPALSTLTGAFADVLDMMNRSILEGGVLQDILVSLGAVASLLADGLAELVRVAGREGEGFFTTLIDWLSRTATSAFQWGIDIAVMLADGLIQGAAAAITFAMQMITNLLTGWLSPGSPPKVAPDIITWGMETMTMWLEGFGKADFGILRGIQRPLRSAFDVLKRMGEISGKEAAEAFISISEAIASGATGEDLFAQIEASAGEFGKEIADLARLEFGLAESIEAVTEAEEALAQARKDELEAGKRVSEGTREFNRLLREGVTGDVLDAKLAEIAAAEDARDLAKQQRGDAEAQVDVAREQQDLLREQLDLQKALVDQLILLAQMSIIPVEAIKEAPGVGEDIGKGIGGGLEGTFPDIGEILAEKIAEAKQKILDAITELMAPIKTKWEEEWEPIFDALGDDFEEFTETISQFYEDNIEPTFIRLGEWLEEKLPEAWETLQGASDAYASWLQEHMIPVLDTLEEIFVELADIGVAGLTTAFEEGLLPASKTIREYLFEKLNPTWLAFGGLLRDIVDFINDDLTSAFKDFIDNWLSNIERDLGNINDLLKTFLSWLRKIADKINTMPKWEDFKPGSPPPLALGLMDVNREIQKLATLQIPKLVAGVSLVNNASMVPASRSPIATTVNRSATVNFGGVTVSDGLGLASIEAIVRRTIRSELA